MKQWANILSFLRLELSDKRLKVVGMRTLKYKSSVVSLKLRKDTC